MRVSISVRKEFLVPNFSGFNFSTFSRIAFSSFLVMKINNNGRPPQDIRRSLSNSSSVAALNVGGAVDRNAMDRRRDLSRVLLRLCDLRDIYTCALFFPYMHPARMWYQFIHASIPISTPQHAHNATSCLQPPPPTIRRIRLP